MKLIVTGGAGFIGSAVVRYIIEKTEDEVLVIDKLTYAGNLESLDEVSKSNRFYFKQIDICDRNSLRRAITDFQPDIIMHLAAESHVDRSIDNPSTFIETNVIGTFSRQMKFMVICMEQQIYLQKKLLIHQVVLILHQKHQVITLFELGIELLDYQR